MAMLCRKKRVCDPLLNNDIDNTKVSPASLISRQPAKRGVLQNLSTAGNQCGLVGNIWLTTAMELRDAFSAPSAARALALR